ncbi:predicted protein [Chaetomium globosum CBS 148.51]|uniref:Uncharacterized protein n=1 Tax=Chaetomium globosum (strain ATCC 6205 / CBS 148.51 / DSM 1962 / NBRC 6347 / NRRL 1970) TaxID=306901 RepID=Q2GQF5_CHAGB|nr:uncharacterized protein CHGG_09799 [Chaetomium globosum CBS 148.51]EAQ83395.1 predicted protein [Chaetomium globosum CBS 148.51]
MACLGKIGKAQVTHTSRAFGRPLSIRRTANNDGRTSRFKRSDASQTGPPVRADGENTPTEPTSTQPDSPEPAASSHSATTSQPVGSSSSGPQGRPNPNFQMPPKARKPVDTSSKEYKQFASRYVRLVVALPFFLVTSYFLYERHKVEPQLRLRIVAAGSSSTQEPSSGDK